jgi:hypothetical protein
MTDQKAKKSPALTNRGRGTPETSQAILTGPPTRFTSRLVGAVVFRWSAAQYP